MSDTSGDRKAKSISVLVADDHPIVLGGLLALLCGDTGFVIVASATRGEDALDAIHRLKPDIAVLDVHMPGLSGIEVLEHVSRDDIPTRIILLTATTSAASLYNGMSAGAAAILLKDTAADLLLDCIRCVAAGAEWAPSEPLAFVLERERRRRQTWTELTSHLTPREWQVLELATTRAATKQIAFEIGASEATVKVHLGNIFRKLRVSSRSELADIARDID